MADRETETIVRLARSVGAVAAEDWDRLAAGDPFLSHAFLSALEESGRVGGPSRFYEKATYVSAFAQDKWRMTPRLTLSLGLRYDLEVVPIAETDDPLVESYPVDKNNVQPRIGLTYDLGGGKSVVRGGYGRFFDKTHFELISAILTAGAFSVSFTANFPANTADPGPSNGQLPSDPFLVYGPPVNRALLAQR